MTKTDCKSQIFDLMD